MMKKMKALLTEEQGQGMTQYGLVLGVIADWGCRSTCITSWANFRNVYISY